MAQDSCYVEQGVSPADDALIGSLVSMDISLPVSQILCFFFSVNLLRRLFVLGKE